LELRVHDVAEWHAPVRPAKGGPNHVLAVSDNQDGLVHPGSLEPVEQAREKASPFELDQTLGPLLGQGSEALADARREYEACQGFGPLDAAASSNWSSSCFVLSRWTRSG